MFKSYIRVAIRNLIKNKLYSAINVIGLALGLTVYLFGNIVTDYEHNHDTMFINHERVYNIGSEVSETADIGVKSLNITNSTLGPLIKAGLPEAEAVARTIRRNYLVSIEDNHYFETIRFADTDLTKIFDFEYVRGDASALNDPNGVILSETIALKFFNSTDIVGQTITLDGKDDLKVMAVMKDMPRNSHFVSSFIDDNGYEIIAPLEVLSRIADWDINGNWNNISTGNYTYVMTKEVMPLDELKLKLDSIYNTHANEEQKEFITGLIPKVLRDVNSSVWEMIGMPVLESVQVLGLLVLIIAIVNYTNLATAQSMSRSREVGMRKTLGASRNQLLFQFLTESLTIAFFAMIIAMMFLEFIVPQFNVATNKVVELDYLTNLPWLIVTTIAVGLLAGAYPSFLITKFNPTEALKNVATKGVKGSFFRSTMISVQFVLSIFMLAVVLIVYFQNGKVLEGSEIFPKDEVMVMNKLNKEDILQKEDLLRAELLKNPNITSVTFANQVPFEQSNNRRGVYLTKGDESTKFNMNVIVTDHDFIKTFDIPLIAGRDFSREYSNDERLNDDDRTINVVINQLAAKKLGYLSANEAIGANYWGSQATGENARDAVQYTVIGVVEDQNILGLHNNIKPFMFFINNETHFYGAIRVKKGAPVTIASEIETTWKTILPNYPFEYLYLSGLFEKGYEIFKLMNIVLSGFALMALILALIGLFGLSAFMARGRTKEVGIRKVMGASIVQIVNMLVWKFSKPVMWAIIIALPLAYFAAGMYLDFFSERINYQVVLIGIAGFVAVGLAWFVIALHAVKVARENPINALKYE